MDRDSEKSILEIKNIASEAMSFDEYYTFIPSILTLLWSKHNFASNVEKPAVLSENGLDGVIKEINNDFFHSIVCYKDKYDLNNFDWYSVSGNEVKFVTEIINSFNIELRGFFFNDCRVIKNLLKIENKGKIKEFFANVSRVFEDIKELDGIKFMFFIINLLDFLFENSNTEGEVDNYARYDTIKIVSSLLSLKGFPEKSEIEIYDPCIGEGVLSFYVKTILHLSGFSNVIVRGSSDKRKGYIVSCLKSLILEENINNIKKRTGYLEIIEDKKDFVCCFPYMNRNWAENINKVSLRHLYGKFPLGIPSFNSENLLFIQDSIDLLNENGRGIFILSGMEKNTRDEDKMIVEDLLSKDCVEGIITFQDYYYPLERDMQIVIVDKRKSVKGAILLDASLDLEDSLSNEDIEKLVKQYIYNLENNILHSPTELMRRIFN